MAATSAKSGQRSGFNQAKWKNYLVPSKLRMLGKEYTNDTGHAIEVSVQTYGPASCATDLWVDGLKIVSQYLHSASGGQSCTATVIVPAGSKYCANRDDGPCTSPSSIPDADISLNGWYELR